MRILFTGGGTGGHIYPILAVAEELQILAGSQNPEAEQARYGAGSELELYYIGAPGPYHQLLEKNGIKVSKILSSKLRRYFDLRNFIDAPKFIISFCQALWKIFWLMPDVLFSKGGPGALPIVLVSKFYRILIIIHESDSLPGLTNQISARYAKRIGISFASAADFFAKVSDKVALVGNPIRRSLISGELLEQGTAKRIFGFNPDLPLILVMGGSQGSVRINDFFLDMIEEITKDFQVLHQTGTQNFQAVQQELNSIYRNFSDEEKARYKLVPYFEKDIKDAFMAADIIVSRAGSGSIFEIAGFGKPSILIPLAEAAGDHQTQNAYEYADFGAAIVIEETNLKPNILLNELKKLFSEPGKLKTISEAAKKFSRPNAAKTIAEEILKLGSRPSNST